VSHEALCCRLPFCCTERSAEVFHCVTQNALLLSPIVSHKTLCCCLPLCHTKRFADVSHCVTQNSFQPFQLFLQQYISNCGTVPLLVLYSSLMVRDSNRNRIIKYSQILKTNKYKTYTLLVHNIAGNIT
jgi:hypothetical protein